MARLTYTIPVCDQCGSESDVSEYVVTSRGGRKRLSTLFDVCASCEKDVRPIDWAVCSSSTSLAALRARAAQWTRESDLRPAIERFNEMRAQSGIERSDLRRESAELSAFLQANGNIRLRHIDRSHVERMSDGGACGQFAALDLFFEWCRRVRWMPSGLDPLATFRNGPPPAGDLSNGRELDTCSACHQQRMVANFELRRNCEPAVEVSLCLRCQAKSWLSTAARLSESAVPVATMDDERSQAGWVERST